MGTSLCVSLGWQECACGRAETDELTVQLFPSFIYQFNRAFAVDL